MCYMYNIGVWRRFEEFGMRENWMGGVEEELDLRVLDVIRGVSRGYIYVFLCCMLLIFGV